MDQRDPYPLTNTREFERLRNQHSIWYDDTWRLLKRAGVTRNITVLEIGCGPGLVTLELAREVGSSGRVIAVDRDEKSIAQLKKTSDGQGIANIETHVCDLGDPSARQSLPIDPLSVNIVFGRWIFMYLNRDIFVPVVESLARLIRLGGAMVTQEFGDYLSVSMSPDNDALRPVAKAFYDWIAKDCDGTPEAGIHLPEAAIRCGLVVDHENEISKEIRPGTDLWKWPDEFFAAYISRLVEKKYLSEDQRTQFENAWGAMPHDPNSLFSAWPVRQMIARKPGG